MDKLGVLMSSLILAADASTSSRSLKLGCIKHQFKLFVPEDTGVTLTCGRHHYGGGIQLKQFLQVEDGQLASEKNNFSDVSIRVSILIINIEEHFFPIVNCIIVSGRQLLRQCRSLFRNFDLVPELFFYQVNCALNWMLSYSVGIENKPPRDRILMKICIK